MFSAQRFRRGGEGEGEAQGRAEGDANPRNPRHLRLLEAGESVFHTFFLIKTVVHAYSGAQPLFHALFGVKTLSETLFPVFNE